MCVYLSGGVLLRASEDNEEHTQVMQLLHLDCHSRTAPLVPDKDPSTQHTNNAGGKNNANPRALRNGVVTKVGRKGDAIKPVLFTIVGVACV